MSRPFVFARHAMIHCLQLAILLLVGSNSLLAETRPQVELQSAKSSSPETSLSPLLCTYGSSGYLRLIVDSRDKGASRQDALDSAVGNWELFLRKSDLKTPSDRSGSPSPLVKQAEEQKELLGKLAARMSILAYEFPKVSREVLIIISQQQCERARQSIRLLTIDELRIKIYGIEACGDGSLRERYSCLGSLFSPREIPAITVAKDVQSIELLASNLGLHELFPKARISFVADDSYPNLKAYRFTFDLGDRNPTAPSDSGMSYIAGPYQLFWCGLRHLGQLIGRNVVLTKMYEQKRGGQGGAGLALFVQPDDPFASIANGPYGGEWLSLMPLNRIQTKCELLVSRPSSRDTANKSINTDAAR
jgi:hypothetical protein